MVFGRRQSPPGGKPQQPRAQESARAAEPSLQAPSLQSPEPEESNAKNIVPASKEFVALFVAQYGGRSGTFHPETAIGAAAALTGEFAQRATGFSIPEGKPAFVFGDPINDILYEGAAQGRATVWQCIAYAARDAGVPDSEIPDPVRVVETVVGAIGGPRFPPLTVPEKHYPQEYSPNACVRLRPKVIAIADRYDLGRLQLCLALGMAVGELILRTRDTLPPAISVRLATEIAFGVAKMAPLTEPVG